MKTNSRKEALARTVRLLTRKGTKVTFRGVTPYVASDRFTGKVSHLNLPELPDEPSVQLIDALQGYVDHECGHIFYTPFERIPTQSSKAKLANIFEDIRLEKLLPRDLPGTKDNLERMYLNWLPLMIQPGVDDALQSGDDQRIFGCLLVPTMRAIGGQKAFHDWMDANNYWPHMAVLLARLPGFGAEIQAMETYDDVLAAVDKLDLAMTPPPPPPRPEPEPAPPPPPPPSDEPGEDESDEAEPQPSDDSEPDDGEGHGDGEGTDDEEGDEDDKDCSGENSDAGDDESDGDQDGDDTSGGDEPDDDDDDGEPGGGEADQDADDNGDDADGGDDEGSDGDDPTDDDDGDDGSEPSSGAGSDRSDDQEDDADDDRAPGEDGDRNIPLNRALAMLDPTLRRALYLQKKRDKSVDEIAHEMNVNVDEAGQMLRDARRELAQIMKG